MLQSELQLQDLDLNTGLFRINGNCGFVLKPQILLEGKDPRTILRPKINLCVAIISAQYLPKSEPGKDIIDPYVTVQIFGVPKDELKQKTRTIKDNGEQCAITSEVLSRRLAAEAVRGKLTIGR